MKGVHMSDITDSLTLTFETLNVRQEEGVLLVEIAAPPMNLLGPALVRDLVSLIQRAEADDAVSVLVFRSADPDYFISHVDLTQVAEYRAEAAKLTGEASIALLFRYLSASPLVTIAQIEGRVRAAGSEFVLGCDMRFAARDSAIFCQFEPAFGQLPGGGAAQHLTRLMGRSRALEVMLSAEDYDADLAERYGWINRALPDNELDDFVRALAHRIARFPAGGHLVVKDRVNAIALAPVEEFRRDSDLFGEEVRAPETQRLIAAALKRGFQTRQAELDLASMLGELTVRHHEGSRPDMLPSGAAKQTVVPPEPVRYEVTRLTLPIPGVREFQARYEAAVPDYPHADVADLVSRRVSWSDMVEFIDAAAPYGFLIYFRNDVHPVMSLAGDNADCISYLMGNHTIAERMFRYDPRAMLYAPLHTVIWDDADGSAWFTVDQPSTQFRSLGIPEIATVGAELDRKLAALLAVLEVPVPDVLTG